MRWPLEHPGAERDWMVCATVVLLRISSGVSRREDVVGGDWSLEKVLLTRVLAAVLAASLVPGVTFWSGSLATSTAAWTGPCHTHTTVTFTWEELEACRRWVGVPSVAGTWWLLAPWWTLRMTLRPSSSGTSLPGRRREVFTVKAQPIGLFLSKWTHGSQWWPLCGLFFVDESGTFLLCRWSHDGKFFARMTLDTLSIYETPVSDLFDYLKVSCPVSCLSAPVAARGCSAFP